MMSCCDRQPDAPVEWEQGVPAGVKNYLRQQLKDWEMVDTADYAASWWSFYDSRQVPCFITVDINDDQVADHALLMKRSGEVRLVILIGKNDGWYSHRFADDFSKKLTDPGLIFGIVVEPPAQIDVVYPEEQSLILASNGVTVMELEQRSIIYYWKNDSLKTFYAK